MPFQQSTIDEFWKFIIGKKNHLDAAIRYMTDNFGPDEVFSVEELTNWARAEGIGEIFTDEEVQKHAEKIGMSPSWIREVAQENNHPEDIFSEKELQEWAEDNGYTKE